MATYGRIEAFSGKGDDFEVYMERLEVYLLANDLGEIQLATNGSNADRVQQRNDKRRAILLSIIGSPTYTLLRNLVSPSKPTEKSYQDLVSVLKEHYQPTTSTTVERYKFHTRVRKPHENVSEFVSELKKLAEKCEFKDTLNDMLKDKLVAGINDEKIQKRLLIEKDLTFEKACNIAVTQELASKDIHVLQTPTNTATVNKVASSHDKSTFASKAQPKPPRPNNPSNKQCFRCGDKSHTAPKCKFINAKCHYCSKIGHIERVCLSKKRESQPQSQSNRRKQTGANVVDVEPESSSVDDYHTNICNINDNVNHPVCVDVLVDGKQIKFQLDTGAGVSLINKRDFVKHFGNFPLTPPSVKLSSYTGGKVKVVGEKLVSVQVGDQSADLTLVVVEGDGPALFGRSWLQEIRLPWSKIFGRVSSSLHFSKSRP